MPRLLLDLRKVGPTVGREDEGHAVVAPGPAGSGSSRRSEAGRCSASPGRACRHVLVPALGLDDAHRRQADEEHVVGRPVLGRPLGDRQVAALLRADAVRLGESRVGLPAGRAELLVDEPARRRLVEVERRGGLDGLLDCRFDLCCGACAAWA